ncbi:MAG: winged helix-turn-helix domain-containing protein [Candidatus Methanomethylicaceae archaeon]
MFWEILTYCKTPRLFTSIIQRCDLNSKIAQNYLGFLESKGYIS